MDQNFYYSLGRLVKCPICGQHSDLSIDWLAAPADDRVPLEQMLASKAPRGCTAFHQDPILAWLWFKYHKRAVVFDAVEDTPLVAPATRNYEDEPPYDMGELVSF